MAIASFKGTVDSLQRVFDAAQSTEPATAMNKAQELAFPDPDMVAKVAYFLSREKVQTRPTAHQVADAFAKYILDEAALGRWGSSVRHASMRLGASLLQLNEAAQALGEG